MRANASRSPGPEGSLMKKFFLIVSIILIAVLAVLFVYFPLTQLNQADMLLTSGAYSEALPAYCSASKDFRTLFFQSRAEAGIAACAEEALAAKDESLIEIFGEDSFPQLSVKNSADRFTSALTGLKQVRADRLEQERIAAEERARAEEEARIAAEKARLEAEAKARQEEREAAYASAVLAHDHLLALSIAESMETEQAREAFSAKAAGDRETDIAELRNVWQKRFGAGTWYTALLSDTLSVQGDPRYNSDVMPTADSLFAGDFGILLIKDGVPSFYGDSLGANKEIAGMTDIVSGSVGMNHALLVHADGTVTAVGARQYQKAEVSEWQDIVSVAAGAFHNVGLTKQGKAVASGLNADLQCETGMWENVTAVSAGLRHTVGLLSDGHVVATGDNSFGQCDVASWTDIIAIACGGNHTVGLRKDGTVVAVGDTAAGQCEVNDWTHVLAIDAGMWHTAALLEDGRVIAIGANENGQCDTEKLRAFSVTEYEIAALPEHGASGEYVYVGDEHTGPWVYYAKEGAVAISLEDEFDTVATRADLFCTAGVYPEGILSGGGDYASGTNMGTTLAKQNHAVFAINGDYYNFGYNPDGVQLRRGQIFKNVISDRKRSLGIAFWPDNTMRVVDPMQIDGEALLALGVKDSWVFGPLLLMDGEVQDISYSPLSFNDITLRSAIGSIEAYHHIALSCGSATLAEVTQMFVEYGCDIAYNLDGGRSVWMTFMGKRVNRTYYNKKGTRNLSDMIGFLHSDSVK